MIPENLECADRRNSACASNDCPSAGVGSDAAAKASSILAKRIGTLGDGEVVTITVNNVNRAPVLNPVGAKSTNENQLLQFRISSSDPDGAYCFLL